MLKIYLYGCIFIIILLLYGVDRNIRFLVNMSLFPLILYELRYVNIVDIWFLILLLYLFFIVLIVSFVYNPTNEKMWGLIYLSSLNLITAYIILQFLGWGNQGACITEYIVSYSIGAPFLKSKPLTACNCIVIIVVQLYQFLSLVYLSMLTSFNLDEPSVLKLLLKAWGCFNILIFLAGFL